jgi:hypothetical protein
MAAPFDEIGYWSELKLEIVEKYGAAYTSAFRNATKKRTKQQIEGSPARALKVSPPFDGFYCIDMDADKTAHLQKLCKGGSDGRSIYSSISPLWT